jgi:acyl dehydratase
VESEPGVWPIERGAIEKFANAIGDSSVLYTDEVAARQTAAGGVVAPPTFLRLLSPGAQNATYKMPYREVLDGGSEYEYHAPIRVGDTITSTVTLVDLFEKPGRLGLMLFRVSEYRYVNQYGQLVATQRTTSINYPDQE